MVTVTFISNTGGGRPDVAEYRDGITLGEFLDVKLGDGAEDFLIKVNGAEEDDDYVIEHGDRVTATPQKVSGAA